MTSTCPCQAWHWVHSFAFWLGKKGPCCTHRITTLCLYKPLSYQLSMTSSGQGVEEIWQVPPVWNFGCSHGLEKEPALLCPAPPPMEALPMTTVATAPRTALNFGAQ